MKFETGKERPDVSRVPFPEHFFQVTVCKKSTIIFFVNQPIVQLWRGASTGCFSPLHSARPLGRLWMASEWLFLPRMLQGPGEQRAKGAKARIWACLMLIRALHVDVTCHMTTLLCEWLIESIGKCFVFYLYPHLNIRSNKSAYIAGICFRI